MTAAEYPSPLPAARRLDAEGIGGRIKERPEDFLVEELPLYEPTGAGEHLMLRVQKTGLAHGEMIRRIARHFGVREREIGCAGMKDRQAVTMQTITVHTPRTFGPDDVIDSRIAVHWAARHASKIRRGHLAGNRFSIKIRGVDPLKALSAARRLRELTRRGAPNFVGPQRFGYRRNNHIIGILLLRNEWPAALDELLGAGGSRFPEHQKEARDLYDARRFNEALQHWRRADRAEYSAMRELCRGSGAERACLSMGGRALSFFGAAAQSAVFNHALDERLRAGALDQLQAGDLAWVHRSRKMFVVDADELARPELDGRLRALEVSPSGPMWGSKMTMARASVLEGERAALQRFGLAEETLRKTPFELEGARRAMRARIEHSLVDSGFDEDGAYVRLAFELERGGFATTVLREIMGEDGDRLDHRDDEGD